MYQNGPFLTLSQKDRRQRYVFSLVFHAAEDSGLAKVGKLHKTHASIVSEVRCDSLAQYGLQSIEDSVYRLVRRDRDRTGNFMVHLYREHQQPSLSSKDSKPRKITFQEDRHTATSYPVVK
jgi:hypothetical protein